MSYTLIDNDTGKDIIETLRLKDEEIERLKDLCNKYEEEHKTAFEEWKKAINIIKEVREYIEEKNKYNSKPPFLMSGETKKLLEILDKVGDEK